MTTPIRITKESQPKFPCWLKDRKLGMWWHATTYPYLPEIPVDKFNSHWHPDQPTAPSEVPVSGTTGDTTDADWQVAQSLKALASTPPTSPDTATDAAREIYMLAEKEANNGMLPDRTDLAAIIRRVVVEPLERELNALRKEKGPRWAKLQRAEAQLSTLAAELDKTGAVEAFKEIRDGLRSDGRVWLKDGPETKPGIQPRAQGPTLGAYIESPLTSLTAMREKLKTR